MSDSRPNASSTAAAVLPVEVQQFVRLQVRALQPFDFVQLSTPTPPFAALQIGRTAQESFELRVGSQQPPNPLAVAQRVRLVELGYRSADAESPAIPWTKEVADIDAVLDAATEALTGVLGADVSGTLDVVHGSTKAIHEAEQRLAELRGRVEPLLAALIGHDAQRDDDGDYVLEAGPVRIIVAPRAIPDAITMVRVIAVTNSGVTINPELGLFLARLNFGLMFGRFALDAEHQAIWFDESLLGDDVTDTQLRFTIEVVARTAQEWTARLQQMFGGTTYADLKAAQHAGPKPGAGSGGYL